jgi:hypothetical protein
MTGCGELMFIDDADEQTVEERIKAQFVRGDALLS